MGPMDSVAYWPHNNHLERRYIKLSRLLAKRTQGRINGAAMQGFLVFPLTLVSLHYSFSVRIDCCFNIQRDGRWRHVKQLGFAALYYPKHLVHGKYCALDT